MLHDQNYIRVPVTADGPSAVKQTRPAARTIMVVEDDDDSRFMIRTLLELKGYQIVEARDGREAIELAESARPGLILMDLQLPRLNGFAVTRQLRQHDTLSDVPIVILSGHDPAKHGALARAAGCNEYLTKPINFELLNKALVRLLP
ncbi:MAG TPA: response regulator [Pyrinomonadaceae bacterium]|jgi:CheY-like chemotaxis protein